jgi:hypothetical protein
VTQVVQAGTSSSHGVKPAILKYTVDRHIQVIVRSEHPTPATGSARICLVARRGKTIILDVGFRTRVHWLTRSGKNGRRARPAVLSEPMTRFRVSAGQALQRLLACYIQYNVVRCLLNVDSAVSYLKGAWVAQRGVGLRTPSELLPASFYFLLFVLFSPSAGAVLFTFACTLSTCVSLRYCSCLPSVSSPVCQQH